MTGSLDNVNYNRFFTPWNIWNIMRPFLQMGMVIAGNELAEKSKSKPVTGTSINPDSITDTVTIGGKDNENK